MLNRIMHVIIRSATNLKILDKKSNSKVKNDRENSEIHIKILFQVLMLNEQENNVPSIRKIAECRQTSHGLRFSQFNKL